VYLASFLQRFLQDCGTSHTERDGEAAAGTIDHDLRTRQAISGPRGRARLHG
jgi:hypothetical protein